MVQHRITHRIFDWLVGWLAHWFVGSLVGRLVAIIHCLVSAQHYSGHCTYKATNDTIQQARDHQTAANGLSLGLSPGGAAYPRRVVSREAATEGPWKEECLQQPLEIRKGTSQAQLHREVFS